jgi:hypothetical protein
MSELRLEVHIHNRYQVFDASGELPFSIVFGLCRRSPSDTNPRPITLETAGSLFDVPYALAHGLLTLYERDEHAAEWVKMDVSRMGDLDPRQPESITVPSPVDRTMPWRQCLTEYLCPIDIEGALASVLKVGKRYRIKLGSQDLGVTKWVYSGESPDEETQAVKLISNRAGGNGIATFKIVKSLAWPPKVVTRMRLCAASRSSDPTSSTGNGNTAVEVKVVNTSSNTVSVQTRGHHNILVPYGPWGPDVNDPNYPDDLIRIIDASPYQSPISSLKIFDAATGEAVAAPGRGVCGLKARHDPRPKVDELVKLEPGIPVIRVVDLGLRVRWLKDGQYKIRMQPTGCRWWSGELQKEEGEDERVPARLYKGWTIPIMLETDNEVEVRVKDGKVDTSTEDTLTRTR